MRIEGAAQYIRRAFCVQTDELLDIYEAQNAYFEQAEPRKRFKFLCPDQRCRETLHAKITAVNYYLILTHEQLQGGKKQPPHFRWNPHDEHLIDCELVQRYIERISDPAPASQRKKRVLSDDEDIPVVETFELRGEVESPSASYLIRDPKMPVADRDPNPRVTHRVGREIPSSTVLLQQVVESYHRLCSQRLAGDTYLRIGDQERSYLDWFVHLEDYQLQGARIYHGGAKVTPGNKGAWFLNFMDAIRADGVNDRPTVIIRNSSVERFSRRGTLKATLAEINSKDGAYAHCYFFGTFVAANGRIRALFDDDLARLYVVPRRVG